MPFFVISYVALVEAATLHAAKVTDTHSKSVTVSYLLEVIQADRGQPWLRDDWKQIKPALEAARSAIDALADPKRRIKERRDRHLTHVDKQNLAHAYDEQMIEVTDLNSVFDTVDEIARTLAAHSSSFAQVTRFSIGFGTDGSAWIADLVYFARAGFENEAVPSPSVHSERIREWERIVRRIRADDIAVG